MINDIEIEKVKELKFLGVMKNYVGSHIYTILRLKYPNQLLYCIKPMTY